MYIVTEQGKLLNQYSKFDPGTVPAAYRWIALHGYRVVSVQCVMGNYYLIVR